LLFVALHVPGWYFAGRPGRLMMPVGGGLSIFVLGLAFGYASHRSRSVAAAMIAHFMNNAAA
jgi:membrane protease YdiL (CAAX protease family)